MVLNKTNIWNEFLDIMHSNFQDVTFNLWFGKASLYDISDNTITLLVPMPLHKKMFLNNYKDIISDAFYKILGEEKNIERVLEDEIENNIEEEKNVDNKEDINSLRYYNSNLNPNLTFENFVVGDTNKFAHTAALAVAKDPGVQYNPLFIYGKSGLGKTHLMHAIGNYIVNNNSSLKVFILQVMNLEKIILI